MTSAQKGEQGIKKCSKFADKSIECVDREGGGGGKKTKSMWTSYMEAPKALFGLGGVSGKQARRDGGRGERLDCLTPSRHERGRRNAAPPSRWSVSIKIWMLCLCDPHCTLFLRLTTYYPLS